MSEAPRGLPQFRHVISFELIRSCEAESSVFDQKIGPFSSHLRVSGGKFPADYLSKILCAFLVPPVLHAQPVITFFF
jgi:hypothetical protein